jgi:hypothetical protein
MLDDPVFRAERALEEERRHQARRRKEIDVEARLRRWAQEYRDRTKRMGEAILEALTMYVVAPRRGQEMAQPCTFSAELDWHKDRVRFLFRGIAGPPGCGAIMEVPGGFDRIRRLFASCTHPEDLAGFEERGKAKCARHEPHPAVIRFPGLCLKDIGLEPCSCRYRVSRPGPTLILGPLTFHQGERIPDLPPGCEDELRVFLRRGYIIDAEAPKPPPERPKPAPDELLDAALRRDEQER